MDSNTMDNYPPPDIEIIVWLDSARDACYRYYTGQDGNCGSLGYKLRRNGSIEVWWLTLDADGHGEEIRIHAPGTWYMVEVTKNEL